MLITSWSHSFLFLSSSCLHYATSSFPMPRHLFPRHVILFLAGSHGCCIPSLSRSAMSLPHHLYSQPWLYVVILDSHGTWHLRGADVSMSPFLYLRPEDPLEILSSTWLSIAYSSEPPLDSNLRRPLGLTSRTSLVVTDLGSS